MSDKNMSSEFPTVPGGARLVLKYVSKFPPPQEATSEETKLEAGTLRDASPRWLALGCREGTTAIALASKYAVSVLGVDDDAEALMAARFFHQQAKLKGSVKFRFMDLDALDLAPESFSAVISEGNQARIPLPRLVDLAQSLLRSDGLLYLLDAVWLRRPVPTYVKDVWETVERPIHTLEESCDIVREHGLEVLTAADETQALAAFYSGHLDAVREAGRRPEYSSGEMKKILLKYKHEVDVYTRHQGKKWMGYGVIVAEKPSKQGQSQTES
ncbi:MAG: class I SAM-dependent methyltransferase [Chlorobi bacterium]|nr:class I SAM-dependent methyltransferase [Chlorobiota bacterium]